MDVLASPGPRAARARAGPSSRAGASSGTVAGRASCASSWTTDPASAPRTSCSPRAPGARPWTVLREGRAAAVLRPGLRAPGTHRPDAALLGLTDPLGARRAGVDGSGPSCSSAARVTSWVRTGSEAAHLDRLRDWTLRALPRGPRDARVVGPGLRVARRLAVRGEAPARSRSRLAGHGLRQVGPDQRRGRRPVDRGADPRHTGPRGSARSRAG